MQLIIKFTSKEKINRRGFNSYRLKIAQMRCYISANDNVQSIFLGIKKKKKNSRDKKFDE